MQYKKLISILFLVALFAIITACGQGDSVTFNSSNEGNALGQVALAWDAPATNINGAQTAVVAGYTIYYGTSSGNYTALIDAGNVTTYTMNLLSGTTYYFAVVAYDSLGNASDYSDEVSATIQ